MAFHEVRFPDNISRGARGGPERRTQIVELASGDEERNASWANSRRRYDVAYGIRRADDLAAVVAFFEARNGRLHGFRFKDWGDHKSCLPSGTPSPTDQAIGTGDGATTAFQLVKRYASGAQSWTRAIAKPVAGNVRIALGGRRAALRLVGRHHDRSRHLRCRAGLRRRHHRGLRVRRARPLRQRRARRDARPRAARLDHFHPASGDPAMNDETGFIAAVLRELAASTAVILAAWGALGGATNALTTKMRLRDAIRHILLGGLIAAGMGSVSMALVTSWLGLPPEAVPAGGAAGSAAYLVGIFGPAFIEVVLARLRRGKAGDGDA